MRVSGVLPPLSSKEHQSCTLLTVLEPTEVEFSLFQVPHPSIIKCEIEFSIRSLCVAGGTAKFHSSEQIPVGPLRRHIPVQHVGPSSARQTRDLQQETGEQNTKFLLLILTHISY